MNLQCEDISMFQIVGEFLVFSLFALNDYSKSTEKTRNWGRLRNRFNGLSACRLHWKQKRHTIHHWKSHYGNKDKLKLVENTDAKESVQYFTAFF